MVKSSEFASFGAIDKYVQGKNLLLHCADFIRRFGKKALIVTDSTVYKIIGQDLQNYLNKNGFSVEYSEFNGESSMEEINRIVKIAKEKNTEFIISLGGGKALDTGKGVAFKLSLPDVIAPTAASCDSACIPLSIIYTPQHEFVQYLNYPHHAELVLVDTQVCANAPTRTLLAGIGDAFASYYECLEVQKTHGFTLMNARQSQAGIGLVTRCNEILWKYAYQALEASKSNVVDTALDKVVEASVLLSGTGSENAGIAAAHSIYDGWSLLEGDPTKFRHGEEVVLGIMIQMMLDGTPTDRLNKFIKFFLTCGFPLTSKDFHLDKINHDDLYAFAKKATSPGETIENMPQRSKKITPDMLLDALKGSDAAVETYKRNHDIKPIFEDKVF